MMGFFSSLFSFLQEKIPYAVLRNYDDLPEKSLPGSDVDLLIRKKDKDKYFSVVKKTAKKTGSLILLKFDRPNCLSCFIYQKGPLAFGVWLDAFTEISSKSFVWADSDFLLRNHRQHQKGFFILPAGGEAVTLFVKEIFSHSLIKERYRLKIPDLVKNDRENFIRTFKPYFGEKTIQEMVDICLNGKWEKAIKKRGIWFFQLILKSFLCNPFGQGIDLFNFFFCFFKKILSQRGISVAVMGPDGVGKTTVCKNLENDLKKLFFKNFHQYHGHFGFFPEWGKTYRLIFRKESNQKENFLRGEKRISALRAVFSVLYYGLEYFLAWPWIIWLKMRGNLVIFDRYFYDFLTTNTTSSLPLKLFWLMTRLIHRPDFVFVLEARPGTIFARKKELSLEEIKRQSELFRDERILKLASVVFVDGEEPSQTVSGKIKEEIFKKLSEKIS